MPNRHLMHRDASPHWSIAPTSKVSYCRLFICKHRVHVITSVPCRSTCQCFGFLFRLKHVFSVVRQLRWYETWSRLILCRTAVDRFAGRDRLDWCLKDDRERSYSSRATKHLFNLDLNEPQICIYTSNASGEWANQLRTVFIMWLLENRRFASETSKSRWHKSRR